jgi:hypothetical protein
MTESRAYINEIENEQTIIMNPDILPTQKEWRLICAMVKQQRELTEWEIKECWEEATEMREHFCSQYFDFAQLILKKAREK